MAEAVRLVIWDLDETFWKGTVTEGGISEYVDAHHDIVIELARRGIMSSICSKNDAAPILDILREKQIFDYFIFPSINWEPKGGRLATLVETVALRPASVMFIDDNPGNRGEAADRVPDLQIEDEHFIARMLDDPRFRGKNDEQLTRLAQYKLLEARKQDEVQASGDNAAFLRTCDVRVRIEYDVMAHLDRTIELINRTNQLNFTKNRLPEDMNEAREILAAGVNDRWRQCGLVHVVDKYGDYGFVGFFMVQNGILDVSDGKLTQKLIHYCFSCRTLGMHVERWLYDRLQRPIVKIAGEVLTDLHAPGEIDWIRMVTSIDDGERAAATMAPEIRVHGGCEAASVAHYLGAHSDNVVVTGNFHAGAHFARMNGLSLMLSAADRRNENFRREAIALRTPYEMLTSPYFDDVPDGTIFVFGGQYDLPGTLRYRHKIYGWEFSLNPPRPKGFAHTPDVTRFSAVELSDYLALFEHPPQIVAEIAAVAWHIHRHYEGVRAPKYENLVGDIETFLDRIPKNSRIVFMLDHTSIRQSAEVVQFSNGTHSYNDFMRNALSPYPFVGTACFSDAIEHDGEIQIGGNHYDRMVYCRMADRIMEVAKTLEPKAGRAGIDNMILLSDFTLASRFARSTGFAPFSDRLLHQPVAINDLLCGPGVDAAGGAAH